MSVVVHEFSHGYMAYRLGDNTAFHSGRLTLNPIKHLDPIGSVLLPFILIISHSSFVVGWARPVPYNPNNLRDKKYGEMLVAFAGVFANLVIALIFGLLIRFGYLLGLGVYSPDLPFYKISSTIVLLNLVLAVFNLVPIPPLDGSKVLFSFLPFKYRYIETFMEKWGIIFLLIFIIAFRSQIAVLVYFLFGILTGIMY